MKNLYLILITIIVFGCKPKEPSLEERLGKVAKDQFTLLMKNPTVSLKDTIDKIDSFRVLRIDTFTAELDSIAMHKELKVKIGRLTEGLEILEANGKVEALLAQKIRNLLTHYYDRDIKILKMIQKKTIDSVSFKGYLVNFSAEARTTKNESIKIDSGALIFSPSLAWINTSERIDYPNFIKNSEAYLSE